VDRTQHLETQRAELPALGLGERETERAHHPVLAPRGFDVEVVHDRGHLERKALAYQDGSRLARLHLEQRGHDPDRMLRMRLARARIRREHEVGVFLDHHRVDAERRLLARSHHHVDDTLLRALRAAALDQAEPRLDVDLLRHGAPSRAREHEPFQAFEDVSSIAGRRPNLARRRGDADPAAPERSPRT
jgi:hypothetical protein